MISMFLYAVAIMYTPGPMNLIGLNKGINRRLKSSIGFFIGVGLAMLFWFIIFGYTGQSIIKIDYIIYISFLGSGYILYLSHKVWVHASETSFSNSKSQLNIYNGFLMQLINPKAIIASLPIATIHFVSLHISGINILLYSSILSILAFLAPTSYAVIGSIFGQIFSNRKILVTFNKIMALILAYVAFDIIVQHIIFVLMGINAY